MGQKLDLKIKGLWTNPNDLSEVPQGALRIADNLVIEKESIAESRRGQKAYGNPLPDGIINKIFNYRNRLICNYASSLAYDSNNAGNWIPYPGTYVPPDGFKMRSIGAQRNFYFTSTKGIYKLDSITSTPRAAGAFKGLDGYAELNPASGGFLADGNQVAYRVVLGYKDKNQNLILGSPSQRIIVVNSSGGPKNVDVTFTLPAGITGEWFYQLYRSGESGGANIEPNDELQLVMENNPSAVEIANLEVTVTDNTPNDLRGATLYTSPSQQGIANSNEPPPFAKDMDVYKDHVFYANVKSKQRLYLTIISVETPSFGYLSTTGDTSTTSAVITDIPSTADLRPGMRVVCADFASDTVILSVDSGTQVTVSNPSSGSSDDIAIEFQDRLSIAGVDYWGGSAQDIATDQFLVYTAGTPAENIAETSLNLVELINKSPSNTFLYAYYVSGYNELPGRILFEERELGGAAFSANSSYGDSFNPPLADKNLITAISATNPTQVSDTAHGLITGESVRFFETNSVPSIDGDRVVTVLDPNLFSVDVAVNIAGTSGYWIPTDRVVESTNDERQNVVCISKPNQPEAVPLFAFLPVGSADEPIRRIIALRDSVFVLKDDGIYRITGEDISTFRVSLFDNTAIIRAPESAVAFNNQVFTFSDQGIIAISDNGVAIMSRPIEGTLLELSSEQFVNFDSVSFGVSYESSRRYAFHTVTNEDDEFCTQAFIYNSLTNTWTRWVMDRSCGVVGTRDNKLYMGQPLNDYVYQERKDFELSDYADEEYPVTVLSSSGFEITLADASVVEEGFTITQTNRQAIVESVDEDTGIITVSQDLPWSAGGATVFRPIETSLQWVPIDVENPGILKQFQEITLIFRDAAFDRIFVDFSTNFSENPETTEVRPQSIGPWGLFPWGTIKWGGGLGGQQPIRTYVPLEKQRSNWLNLKVYSAQAFTSFSLAGLSSIYNPMTSRFR